MESSRGISAADVDRDLWEALDLCTDEELVEIHAILYEASPFSPLVKSIVAEKEPAAIEYRGRSSLMYKLESRFRFLAADSISTFKGRRPSYRETLETVRSKLDVPCPPNLRVQDLELETFLHVMRNCEEFLDGVVESDRAAEAAAAFAAAGDGMASFSAASNRSSNPFSRITAPLRLGAKTILPTLTRLAGAVTIDSLQRDLLRTLGAKLLTEQFTYKAALKTLCGPASRAAGACASREVAAHAAGRGLTQAAATYGMARGALSLLGPLMWATLAAELAMKSVGTDYARVVRAICVLAQARLLRTGGWSTDGDTDAGEWVDLSGGF